MEFERMVMKPLARHSYSKKKDIISGKKLMKMRNKEARKAKRKAAFSSNLYKKTRDEAVSKTCGVIFAFAAGKLLKKFADK